MGVVTAHVLPAVVARLVRHHTVLASGVVGLAAFETSEGVWSIKTMSLNRLKSVLKEYVFSSIGNKTKKSNGMYVRKFNRRKYKCTWLYKKLLTPYIPTIHLVSKHTWKFLLYFLVDRVPYTQWLWGKILEKKANWWGLKEEINIYLIQAINTQARNELVFLFWTSPHYKSRRMKTKITWN